MATPETTPPSNDITAAAANAQAENPAANARRWLLQAHHGTLCTTAAHPSVEGFPFGSVVPFALDPQGRPVVFIADIAAHTANVRRDPRATLFVHDPHAEGDPQKTWRIGVMGKMVRLSMTERDDATTISAAAWDDIHARYIERVPAADGYAQTHGFAYWRMEEVVRVRYIAGFGKICWFDGAEMLYAPDENFAEAATHAVDHMNADHAENMREMCRGLYRLDPKAARMLHLDPGGFDVVTEEPAHRLRFSFDDEVDAETLRGAVIGVLKRARAQIGA